MSNADDDMSRSSAVTIHAEYLTHVRTMNITATLPSPVTPQTSARITDGGESIILRHNGQQHLIALPGKPKITGSLDCAPRYGASARLEYRIPSEPWALSHPGSQTHTVPWSATMLGAQAELICRSCRSVIVQRGSIIQWKDLPSEGWAEMMDFWHCHKPDDHGQEGHYHASIGTKGYAAAGRLVAKPGVGFVDVLSFLLAETDCTEVKVGLRVSQFLGFTSDFFWRLHFQV